MSNSFGTPWTVANQVLLSIGFARQEYWSGLSFPSSGDHPNPGIKLPALAGRFFTTELPGKPQRRHTNVPANWHTNWCLTSLIKEMQIKITMRYYLTSVKMGIIKQLTNSKYWRECRERECSYSADGNISWYNHYGEQNGGSLKN